MTVHIDSNVLMSFIMMYFSAHSTDLTANEDYSCGSNLPFWTAKVQAKAGPCTPASSYSSERCQARELFDTWKGIWIPSRNIF